MSDGSRSESKDTEAPPVLKTSRGSLLSAAAALSHMPVTVPSSGLQFMPPRPEGQLLPRPSAVNCDRPRTGANFPCPTDVPRPSDSFLPPDVRRPPSESPSPSGLVQVPPVAPTLGQGRPGQGLAQSDVDEGSTVDGGMDALAPALRALTQPGVLDHLRTVLAALPGQPPVAPDSPVVVEAPQAPNGRRMPCRLRLPRVFITSVPRSRGLRVGGRGGSVRGL
jgi:hypothetical protein